MNLTFDFKILHLSHLLLEHVNFRLLILLDELVLLLSTKFLSVCNFCVLRVCAQLIKPWVSSLLGFYHRRFNNLAFTAHRILARHLHRRMFALSFRLFPSQLLRRPFLQRVRVVLLINLGRFLLQSQQLIKWYISYLLPQLILLLFQQLQLVLGHFFLHDF